MAEWLTPRTPDLEVRGPSLMRPVISLDRELYSLFTQVKTGGIPLGGGGEGGEGVTLLWTSIPSRREYQYS